MLLGNQMKSLRSGHRRRAFTLVELMVVIAIIGILMGLLVPAVMAALGKARVAAMKTEVDGIASAVEAYRDKYGEYPPDFSDSALVLRHFRTIFPQITVAELQLLTNMMNQGGAFSEQNVNRAEAVVFVLGGYSENPLNPLTGDGGPFEYVGPTPGTAADFILETNYQYRVTRTNALFTFDPTNLNIEPFDPSVSAVPSPTNKNVSEDDGDVFPVYSPANKTAPIIYFDSRTYGFLTGVGVPNCFPAATASSTVGYARPLKVPTATAAPTDASGSAVAYGSVGAAIRAWEFANPKTFQVMSAGDDDEFGSQAAVLDSSSGLPIYFFAGTGDAMLADPTAIGADATLLSVSRFQEVSLDPSLPGNYMADNLTNFAPSTLASEL